MRYATLLLPLLLALGACQHADHATSVQEIGVITPGQHAETPPSKLDTAQRPVEMPVPSTSVPRATDAGVNHEGGELSVP